MNWFLIILILFTVLEYSATKRKNSELNFLSILKIIVKTHSIFFALFITLSISYYFIKSENKPEQKIVINENAKTPIKKVTIQKNNWKYEELEGNKIASLQSINAVNIIPQKPELKLTYLYIEYLKFNDNTQQSYIKITRGKGRHPCWDEEVSCYVKVNGAEFKLIKGENFQEMLLEDTTGFMESIKDKKVKLVTPLTIQPTVSAAFVEEREFEFDTHGMKI